VHEIFNLRRAERMGRGSWVDQNKILDENGDGDGADGIA
jgi:hypothetical protein